jgi:drug/metabolite transporter (DMT)-like permease
MKPIDPHAFDRNQADAAALAGRDKAHVIRTQMNGRDWLVLLSLALIWGSAFFFIGVAVRHVQPLTYVWLRLAIAAAGMWIFVRFRGGDIDLRPKVWGSMLVLALLNNAIPFALFGWGQTHIASGLASILNATTPIWGVVVAHFLTHDERMVPRKVAGVLLGFGGVATMIGPSLLSSLGVNALAQLACVTAAAGALIMFPVSMIVDRPWTHAFPPLSAIGAIVALALLCSAFAYVLYFRLIDRAGATNALLVTLLVPPVAIVLGALFLNETLASQDFLGLGLIALGLAAIDGRALSLFAARKPQPAA